MTDIVNLDYSSVPEREAIANFIVAGDGPIDYHGSYEPAGAWETAGLIWSQETIIGSTIAYGFSKDRNQINYEYNPTFNPIKHWHVNQEKYGDISPYIRGGLFNDVVSEQQFLDRRERLLDEQSRRERIANGSGWGMLMGMGLSLVDIATLIPLGWAMKGTTVAKVGKMAFGAGVLTGTHETIMHMQQDLRTTEESIYNVGFSIPIGAGLGVFASALNKGSRLNPAHKQNPFNKDNPIRMGFANIYNGVADSAVVQPVTRGGRRAFEVVADSSVGAATVKASKVVKAGVFTAPLRVLHKATPAGRLLYAKASKAREAVVKLVDTGGILTESMGAGIAYRSAEDFYGAYMQPFENWYVAFDQTFTDLRMQLEGMAGGIQNPTIQAVADKGRQAAQFIKDAPSSVRGKLDETTGLPSSKHFQDFEFQDLIYKMVHDDLDAATVANLTARFGQEGSDLIVAAGKQMSDEIHAMNKVMEDLMVNAVDKNGRPMITERQRMGDEYGVAQIWNPKAMRGENRQAAINFFIEKFVGKPNDEFLLVEFGMTPEQFAKLGREEVKIGDDVFDVGRGADQRQEILEEWSGDSFDRQVLQAELEVSLAEAQLESARREAVWSGRDLRKSDTDYRKSSIAEAKKILERRVLERDKSVAEREKLQLEREAVKTEVSRLEAEQEARMNQFHETGKWTRKYTKARTSDVEDAEGLLSYLENAEGGAPHADIVEARMMLTEADDALARVGDDALDAAVADAATKPVYSRALDKLKERQNQINRQVNRIDRRLERLDPRITKVNQAVAAASDAVIRVRESRKVLRAAKKEADKGVRTERRNVKKAKKSLRRQEKKLPVHLYVEGLVDTLGKQNKIPRGILESEAFESARTKDRKIILSNEERREAIRLGLLRNDLLGIMYAAHDDISKRLSLRKVFGSETSDDVVSGVRDEYDHMISQARKNTKLKNPTKHVAKLIKERDNRIKDIQGLWERHLGIHALPDSAEGGLHWSLQKLRAWNFIKYGTGFLVSSLTDPASVALTSGFHAMSRDTMRATRRSFKGMRSEEIRRLAIMSERVLHNSRTLKIADVSDIASMSGLGDKGTIKHGLTSTVDRAIQGLSDTASVASGMVWWNTRLKALGMMEMQHNLVGLMQRYDDLLQKASAGNKKAELEIAKLASVGIGEEQARRIAAMMKKHPPQKFQGIFELEMSRWIDEGELGAQAYSDVLFALRRTANRAVMTPGNGETPLFMSTAFGKTYMQFQTYGFVALNRFITPALQRGMSYNDMDAFLSMALAAGLGTVVVSAKDWLRTGEIKERNAGEWAYDVLDRSGYLMYLTIPSALAFNAANVYLGTKSAPSRYANLNNQWQLLLGPSGSSVADALGAGQGALYGDAEQVGKHINKLLPYQVFKQVGERVLSIGD